MTATINQIKSLGIDGFDMKRFILGGYYDKEEDFPEETSQHYEK